MTNHLHTARHLLALAREERQRVFSSWTPTMADYYHNLRIADNEVALAADVVHRLEGEAGTPAPSVGSRVQHLRSGRVGTVTGLLVTGTRARVQWDPEPGFSEGTRTSELFTLLTLTVHP
jgi:hypothetical protein